MVGTTNRWGGQHHRPIGVRIRASSLTANQDSFDPPLYMGWDIDGDLAPTGTGFAVTENTSASQPHHRIGSSHGQKNDAAGTISGFPIKTWTAMSSIFFYDDSAGTFEDISQDSLDAGVDDIVTTGIATADFWYFGQNAPFDRLTFVAGSTPNAVTAALAGTYSKDDNTWAAVGNIVDGTDNAGAPLGKSGDITWDAITDWQRTWVSGRYMYWLRIASDTLLNTAVASGTQWYPNYSTGTYYDDMFSMEAAIEGTPSLAGTVTHSDNGDSFDFVTCLWDGNNVPSYRYLAGAKCSQQSGVANMADDLKLDTEWPAIRGGQTSPVIIWDDNGTFSDVTGSAYNTAAVAATAFAGGTDAIYLLLEIPYDTFDFSIVSTAGALTVGYWNGTNFTSTVTKIMGPTDFVGDERYVFDPPSGWTKTTVRAITSDTDDDNVIQYYALKIGGASGTPNVTDIYPLTGVEDMVDIQVFDSVRRFDPKTRTITITDGTGTALTSDWKVQELSWTINRNATSDTRAYNANGDAYGGFPQSVELQMANVSGSLTIQYKGKDDVFNTFKAEINRQNGSGYWQQIELIANKSTGLADEYYKLKLNNIVFTDISPGGITNDAAPKTFSADYTAEYDDAAGIDGDSEDATREVVMEVGQ